MPCRAAAFTKRLIARSSDGALGSSSDQRIARSYWNERERRGRPEGRVKYSFARFNTKGRCFSGISEVAPRRTFVSLQRSSDRWKRANRNGAGNWLNSARARRS